jgi:hypothetical protein
MAVRLSPLVKKKSYSPLDVVEHCPQSNLYNAAGVFQSVFASAFDCTMIKKSESIAYTTKRRSERNAPNWCRHIRNSEQYIGRPDSYRITFVPPNPNPNWYTDYYAHHAHAANAHGLALTTAYGATQLNVAATPVYPGDAQADMDATIASLRPDLTVVSLPNFLLELDDMATLWKQFKKNVGLARSLLSNSPGAFKRVNGKLVAENHLAYSFGWKPAEGDIRSIIDAFLRTMERIEAFEKAANQVLTNHARLEKTSVTKSGNFTYASSHKCYWSGTKITTKTAGLVYRALPLEVTKGYKLMLQAYIDALGFELNPRIIWDAIPFSFVIDWFFGVGSWLERHKYDTLELPISYIGSYCQVKEAVQVESRLVMGGTTPVSGQSPSTYPCPPKVTSRIYFERFPVTPSSDVLAGLGWKKINRRQLTLGASLVEVLRH